MEDFRQEMSQAIEEYGIEMLERRGIWLGEEWCEMSSQDKKIEFIRNHLTQDELLVQLAEEAAELAQAALKLRRAFGKTGNPTPIRAEDAFTRLAEEVADVKTCMEVLRYSILIAPSIDRFIDAKLTRWVQRIEDMEAENDEQIGNQGAYASEGMQD